MIFPLLALGLLAFVALCTFIGAMYYKIGKAQEKVGDEFERIEEGMINNIMK